MKVEAILVLANGKRSVVELGSFNEAIKTISQSGSITKHSPPGYMGNVWVDSNGHLTGEINNDLTKSLGQTIWGAVLVTHRNELDKLIPKNLN